MSSSSCTEVSGLSLLNLYRLLVTAFVLVVLSTSPIVLSAESALATPTPVGEYRASGSAAVPDNLIEIEPRLSEEAVRENAGLGYDIASDDAVAARATTVASKIEGQLAKRGWSRSSVDDAISNPTRTVSTRDTRHLPGGGRNNDPATAYYSRDGGYVVRNDRTGDVVQVSNRNNLNWRAPWD